MNEPLILWEPDPATRTAWHDAIVLLAWAAIYVVVIYAIAGALS